MSNFTSTFRVVAIASAVSVVVLAVVAFAVPAEAKAKRKVHRHQAHHGQVYRSYVPPSVSVGGGYGPNTYARAPRSYGGNPGNYRNVPNGRPDAFQRVNGCYGGREQVLRGGRLVWVPNVTCPYAPDFF